MMLYIKLILLSFILLFHISECSFEFIAHNFVNYKVKGTEYGLPYLAVHGKLRQFVPENYGLTEDSDKFQDHLLKLLRSGRNVYTLRVEDLLTKKFYWSFFKNVLKTKNNSLLLVLPKKSEVLVGKNKTCDEAYATEFSNTKLPKCKTLDKLHQDTLNKLENYLYVSKPKCSLSVTEWDDNMVQILKESKTKGGVLSDDVRVTAKHFDSKPISSFLTLNLYGELNTSDSTNTEDKVDDKNKSDTSKPKKRVLVATSLDTFGLLQTYSSTAQFNSGLIVLLELTRLLKNVKSDVYDLFFLLYSGSVVNYSGLRYFLGNFKNAKDFEFVVHFADMSGDKLYLHKLQSNQHYLDPFTKLFVNKMNIDSVIKKSTDPNKDDEELEGENYNYAQLQFGHDKPLRELENAELGLPNEVDFNSNHNSFTVTSTHDSVPLYKRSSSLTYKFDVDLVTQRVLDAAKTFTQLLKAAPVEFDADEVKENVKNWQETLNEPRNVLTTNLMLLDSVKKVLSHLESNLGKVQVQNFRTNAHEHKFHSTAPNTCMVFSTKHPLFDVVVFVVVSLYILVVWSVARGSVKVAVDDISGLIQKALSEKNFKIKRRQK